LNIGLSPESEKIILVNYGAFMVVQPGKIPSVKQIYDLTKQYMDMNCYDIIYPEVFLSINQDLVAIVLDKNKYVHIRKDGILVYEAQNILFENWCNYQKLLLQG
jgi:hypothetical protein